MGSALSGDIKYMYTNINGNNIPVPYIRLSNGSWMPLQQYNQSWYRWHAQRALPAVAGAATYINPTLVSYPVANQFDYYIPGQTYYGGPFFR